MQYIVKISNGSYHLYEKGATEATPFAEILLEENVNKSYKLFRKFDNQWEKVGEINLKGLLLLPIEVNSVFHSLQRKHGESYTWKDFCEARQKKISKK